MWTAFVLGVFGGAHCLLMCGPLVMYLKFHRSNYGTTGFLLHQSGRIFGYVFLGAITGFISYGFSLVMLHKYVALALGIILCYSCVISFLPSLDFLRLKRLSAFSRWIGAFQSKTKKSSLAVVGFINAFLPCGLVYVALAASAAFFDPIKGSVYMLFFGLGTLPALGLSYVIPQKFVLKLQSTRWLLPLLTGLVGILLVLRGLTIGIPYISPQENQLNVAPVGSAYECAKE
ncbi:MAG: sulfite exporter TauE/SafE family protein [Flavobacteriaceae bacterium]